MLLRFLLPIGWMFLGVALFVAGFMAGHGDLAPNLGRPPAEIRAPRNSTYHAILVDIAKPEDIAYLNGYLNRQWEVVRVTQSGSLGRGHTYILRSPGD